MIKYRSKKGAVLILSFMIMTTITAITLAFLYITSIQIKASGHDMTSSKALWLAEAGLQKAIWNLKTPILSDGEGEDWTTAGTTENLGEGSYTMEVERWDWALAAHNSEAVATTQEIGHEADKAIDGDDGTYWETVTKPLPPGYENITIAFPYPLTINKVRYVAPDYQKRPKEYEWQVSTDGVDYATVFSNSSGTMDETNEFAAVTNVNYLRLWVTKIGGGALSEGLQVSTVEAIGSKITSTSTVDVINRKIEQTVAVDDATQTAYDEIDWNEITPAN